MITDVGVVRWREEFTDSSWFSHSRESDVAPELGCISLRRSYRKSLFRWLPFNLEETLAIEVIRGEPDPKLFVIPENYRRVKK
jgi:hypothetical protein